MHILLKCCQHVHKLINIYSKKYKFNDTYFYSEQYVDKVIQIRVLQKIYDKKAKKKGKNISYTQLYQQNVNNLK